MTRRSRRLLSILALGIVLLGGAMLPPSAAEAAEPAGLSRAAVLATNSVWLNRDAQVGDASSPGGDVVVNGQNLDGLVLDGGVELSLGQGASINGTLGAGSSNTVEAMADSILINRTGDIAGDVYCNEIEDKNKPATHVCQGAPGSLTLPPFQTAVPGASDVVVTAANSPLTLAPGAYNNVSLANGTTLVLTGGVYDVRSVTVGQSASVLFDDATDLRVLERYDVGKFGVVGPSPTATIDATAIIIYVAGINGGDGTPLASPSAAENGQQGDLDATIYAPNGTIKVDKNSVATGAFIGRDVWVDTGALTILASFFQKAPDAVDDSASVLEGGTVSVLDSTEASVLANDSDPNPQDSLTVTTTAVSGPDFGTVILNADGTFSYTHDGSENFVDAFVYEVCDDGIPVKCSTATVGISITPVNDPPTLDDPADLPLNEDAGPQVVNLTGIAQGGDAPGFNNETQPPQFPLTVTASSDNTALIPHPTVTYASPDATGTLDFTPVADQYGSAVITVTVMDSGGTANGGIDTTTQQFTVTVTSVNDPPIAGDDAGATDEDTATNVNVLANDSAGPLNESQVLNVGSVTQGTSGGTVTNNGSDVTYDPAGQFEYLDTGESANDTFTYTACDTGDGADDPTVLCDTGTVTMTISGINDPPVVNDQNLTTDTVTLIVIDLSGTDAENDPLGYSIVSGFSNPAIGSLSVLTPLPPAGAEITFLPSGDGSTGTGNFVYEACDDGGLCDQATVTITVNTFHNPPIANSQSVTTAAASEVIVLSGSDPEGTILDFSLVSGPLAGGLAGLPASDLASVSVTYTPNNPGDPDTFVFQVCDQGAPVKCATGIVTINSEEPLNNPPQADEQAVATAGVTPIVVTMTGSDPDGDNLTFAILAPPACPDGPGPCEGAMSAVTPLTSTSASVTYAPASGDDLPDQFVFQVCDDGVPVLCDTAIVAINGGVESENDPPSAQADTIRVDPLGTATTLIDGVTTSLLANDTDANGDNLSLTTTPVSGPSAGNVTLNANGTFSYTNTDDQVATDQFDYEVCDDGTPSLCDTATVFIQIIPATINVTISSVTTLGASSGSVVSTPAGIDCGSTCTASFPTDAPIQLAAIPGADSIFLGFGGDADCLDGSLVPDGDKTCTATFDDAPPPQGDPVTITINNSGGGVVTSDPAGIDCGAVCSFIFQNTRIVLSAVPDAGFSFDGFGGDADCADGELDGVVNATCTATFTQLTNQSTLTIVLAGAGVGSVTSRPAGIACGSDCEADFDDGTVVSLAARADPGSVFAGWSGACTGGAVTSVTVSGATSCTATFDPEQ